MIPQKKINFQFIKELGRGAFAEVHLVKDKNNKLFAAKKLNEKNLNQKLKFYLQNEINILKMFNHPNIIKLYSVFKNPNYTCLILEYCSGGSLDKYLYDYISKYGTPFSEKLVQRLMKQILLGVKTLHENGIIHRDLKLGNILIKYNNDYDKHNKNLYNSTIKITDFNMSCKTNVSAPISVVGTPVNMAPTIVQNMNNFPKIYDEKVDIWSLGTICYEMLFGKPPFTGYTKEEIYQKIINNQVVIPKTISVEARTFLFKMLKKDGFNRYSTSQLLNHEFIVNDYHTFHKYNNGNIYNINNNNGQLLYNKNNNKNNFNNNNVKFFKKINNNKIKNKNNDINRNITPFINIVFEKCNGCNLKSIFEIIYKCTECADVLYCQNCYEKFKSSHKHNFQKIRRIVNAATVAPKININGINYNAHLKLCPPKIHRINTFQNANNFNANFI